MMQHHIQNTPPTRTHRRCAATAQPQVSTTVNALNRLKKSVIWLESQGIRVIGYCCTTDVPEITVQAGPKTFALFSGRYEQRTIGHDGTCRYTEWEALDSAHQVRIYWTEVTS